MSNLLLVQSSPNLATSISRKAGNEFAETFSAKHPGTTVITRDLVTDPIPHVGADLLVGFFGNPAELTPAQAKALAMSETVIAEVLAADTIVLAMPMHNFSIPSTIKAWIDHLVRAGRTFQYTAEGPKGLISGKRAVVILSTGGIYSDGPYKAYDFQENYLRAVLGFIGISNVSVIRAEGSALGPEAAANAAANASAAVQQLAG